MIKKTRILSLAVLTVVTLLFSIHNAKADLNAQAIVDQFNSSSGGTLFRATAYYSAELEIRKQSGYGFADATAYQQGVTGGSDYFRTFCVEPHIEYANTFTARLNYVNGKSTTSSGHSLSIGASYLYSQFAAGTLSTYHYSDLTARYNDEIIMREALKVLLKISSNTALWNSNVFLRTLLSVNSDANFWMQSYDPNQYYDVIGNYSVFVMNCYQANGMGNSQDLLYVAKVAGSSGGEVPEPATIGLWLLGLGGAAAYRKRVKRTKSLKYCGCDKK